MDFDSLVEGDLPQGLIDPFWQVQARMDYARALIGAALCPLSRPSPGIPLKDVVGRSTTEADVAVPVENNGAAAIG